MNVVQNKVGLVRGCNLWEGFHVKDAGFVPEIYVGDEKDVGLQVVRDGEGWPVKPTFDINV